MNGSGARSVLARLTLPGLEAFIPCARRCVVDAVAVSGCWAIGDLPVLVSELVTNAVKHTASGRPGACSMFSCQSGAARAGSVCFAWRSLTVGHRRCRWPVSLPTSGLVGGGCGSCRASLRRGASGRRAASRACGSSCGRTPGLNGVRLGRSGVSEGGGNGLQNRLGCEAGAT